MLLQLDNGSSIADACGSFVATLPIGGSGAGGVIGTVYGYRYAGIPGSATGSPSLMTNAKAFEARGPAGAFTTGTAWGLHIDATFLENWLGGSLKLGAGDTVTNSSIALEVTDKAIRLANMDTTARNALTAVAGMMIFNTTTSLLEYYDGAAWI